MDLLVTDHAHDSSPCTNFGAIPVSLRQQSDIMTTGFRSPCFRPILIKTLTVIISLLLSPALVNGALFPKNSLVKMIDAKEFRQVMKLNVRHFFFLFVSYQGSINNETNILANELGRVCRPLVWCAFFVLRIDFKINIILSQ